MYANDVNSICLFTGQPDTSQEVSSKMDDCSDNDGPSEMPVTVKRE